MKICLLSDQFESRKSGIGLHAQNMVYGLLENNHQVVLLCSEPRSKDYPDFEYLNIPGYKYDPTANSWLSLAVNTNKNINAIYNKYNFDIFHSLDARQGALSAKKLKVPTIGSVNDYYYAVTSLNILDFIKDYKNEWISRYFYHVGLKFFENKTYNNFDVLVANSTVTKNEIVEHYDLAKEKVKVLSKALNYFPEKKNNVAVKKEGDYRVLMVGFGLTRKGIYYLLDSAADVISKYPKIKFTIVGNTSDKIISLTEKYKIREHFEFFGPQKPSELKPLYQKADVFILPSPVEGFGITMLEAMSYGIPVIGTRYTGFEDLIEDGFNGTLILPRDPAEISKAVIDLLGNHETRQKYSINSFNKAKYFNKKMQLDQTIKLYEQALTLKKHA